MSETRGRAKGDAAEDGQDDTPQAACNAFMMTVPQAPRSGGFFFAALSFSPLKKKVTLPPVPPGTSSTKSGKSRPCGRNAVIMQAYRRSPPVQQRMACAMRFHILPRRHSGRAPSPFRVTASSPHAGVNTCSRLRHATHFSHQSSHPCGALNDADIGRRVPRGD